jgi:hypothetical protein
MKHYDRKTFRYTPFFCEENVWWLVRSLLANGLRAERLQVLLFSNRMQSILLTNQRRGDDGRPVIWDYHVVLRARIDAQDWVFDLDTRLAFPAALDAYLSGTFPVQSLLPERYRTWVRSIAAISYLAHFYSDRSHMLGRLPISAFPDYPIIQPDDAANRIPLSEYRDMRRPLVDGGQAMPVESLFDA